MGRMLCNTQHGRSGEMHYGPFQMNTALAAMKWPPWSMSFGCNEVRLQVGWQVLPCSFKAPLWDWLDGKRGMCVWWNSITLDSIKKKRALAPPRCNQAGCWRRPRAAGVQCPSCWTSYALFPILKSKADKSSAMQAQWLGKPEHRNTWGSIGLKELQERSWLKDRMSGLV